jgi:hypothetical protein
MALAAIWYADVMVKYGSARTLISLATSMKHQLQSIAYIGE